MIIVDALGKACPTPVIMAKKEIDAGLEEFTVLVDNTTAVNNLKKLASTSGFDTACTESAGQFSVVFTKNGQCPCEEAAAPVAAGPANASWSVFIGKDFIGDGEGELGHNLLKMFIYTLAQGDDIPSSILFMNAGVRIPTECEEAVENLKILQDKGCEILVCGTCLNFYNLSDKLKIGEVSNMYDISQRMIRAGKVITL